MWAERIEVRLGTAGQAPGAVGHLSGTGCARLAAAAGRARKIGELWRSRCRQGLPTGFWEKRMTAVARRRLSPPRRRGTGPVHRAGRLGVARERPLDRELEARLAAMPKGTTETKTDELSDPDRWSTRKPSGIADLVASAPELDETRTRRCARRPRDHRLTADMPTAGWAIIPNDPRHRHGRRPRRDLAAVRRARYAVSELQRSAGKPLPAPHASSATSRTPRASILLRRPRSKPGSPTSARGAATCRFPPKPRARRSSPGTSRAAACSART